MKVKKLRTNGQPVTSLEVVKLPESGMSIVQLDVQDKVTVSSFSVEDCYKAAKGIVIKGLAEVGFTDLRDIDVDIIVRPNEKRFGWKKQFQREVLLVSVVKRRAEPGDGLLPCLVLLAVDFVREFLGHSRSVIRKRRARRLRRKYLAFVAREEKKGKQRK